MKAGITGHRTFDSRDAEQWVRKRLHLAVHERAVSHGYTCLAEGADQLFAQLLLEMQVPYTAIIACDNYQSTFSSDEGLERFRQLQSYSAAEKQLDYSEPTDEAFFAASKWLVDSSEILFAVWDGLPSRGLGGTADVVRYCLESRKPVLHLNPTTQQADLLSTQ